MINFNICRCSFLLICCLVVSGCSSAPVRVPLVYKGPAVPKELTRLAEKAIFMDDQRQDKRLDEFISPNVPEAVRTAMSREFAASGCIRGSTPENPGESRTMPVEIRVKLLAAAVGVPGHGGRVASMWIGSLAFGVVGGTLASLSEGDVVGEIQMQVYVRNLQSGAECEDTWTGVNTIKSVNANMDSSQNYSTVFGGAVKQAVSHLPSILACVGIEPK